MLKFSRGMTLIEIMIGVAIVAILMVMAVPSFSGWIKNQGIRGASESILSGLQLARAEALKKNTQMRFQLTSTLADDCVLSASGPHWVVSRDAAAGLCGAAPVVCDFVVPGEDCDFVAGEEEEGEEDPTLVPAPPPRIFQTYDGTQSGGSKTQIDAGANLFIFNGLGRLTLPTANTAIDVYSAEGEDDCVAKGGKARCLRIEITRGGGIRMCDPALPATDTQACSSQPEDPLPPPPPLP
jgi:type IV fimbrial biogenesis protein FimT